MKTVFLKKMMPIATIALGIVGAFATTSMQSAPNSATPQYGYTLDAQKKCNIEVQCSDVPNPVCRLNGAQAFAKDPNGNCNQITYQP